MKFYSNHAQEPTEQGCKEEKHKKVLSLRDNKQLRIIICSFHGISFT
jgi:hypothetical protein